MENKFKKKYLACLVGIILVGAIVSGCSENIPTKVGENSTTSSSSSSSSSTAATTKKNEPKIFKVGDIVKLKDLNIVVNKVSVVVGDEYSKAKDGNEFLAIDCTIENISEKEQDISSMLMFKVVDKDGRACEYSITGLMAAKSTNSGQLDGTIGVGRKMSGPYVVEVVKGTKGLQLEFSGDLFSSGQVIVNLN